MEAKDIISSGILELYSLGLTSEEENVQVYAWMQQFPEVKEEMEDIRQAIEKYAWAHAVSPASSVKQKIMDRIEGTVPVLSPQRNETGVKAGGYALPFYIKWLAAAGIILLLGSLLFNVTYYNKFRSVSASLAATQTELNRQKEMASAMSRDMDVVTNRHALPVVLSGTPRAPNALAKIFWMRNTGEVFVDPSNLPLPAQGKQYQLWAIVNGKPVDGGMITTPQGIYKIQKMRSFGKAEAFAITLEKKGGSPTPTMEEMYVMSKI